MRNVLLAAAAFSYLGCSGGTGTANMGNAAANSTNTVVIAVPTLPPGRSPGPEITLNGNLAERTNQKRAVDIPPSGPRPSPQYFEAPEDSTITTTMNTRGQVLEIRVFKSHPQLSKVESTWTGPKDRSVKIFLRDGNIRELTTDKLDNLRGATASQILEMVGIAPQKQPAADKGETGVKKRQ